MEYEIHSHVICITKCPSGRQSLVACGLKLGYVFGLKLLFCFRVLTTRTLSVGWRQTLCQGHQSYSSSSRVAGGYGLILTGSGSYLSGLMNFSRPDPDDNINPEVMAMWSSYVIGPSEYGQWVRMRGREISEGRGQLSRCSYIWKIIWSLHLYFSNIPTFDGI